MKVTVFFLMVLSHGNCMSLESLARLNYFDITTRGNDSCFEHLAAYRTGVRQSEPWALRALDASAKFQSGFLDGNLFNFGNYDECLSIKVNSKSIPISGKYCLGRLPIRSANVQNTLIPDTFTNGVPSDLWDNRTVSPTGEPYPQAIIAVCVPSTCFAKQLNEISGRALKLFGLEVLFSDENCYPKHNKFCSMDFFALSVFVTITIMISVATIYDIRCRKKDVVPSFGAVMALSLYTNWLNLTNVSKRNTNILRSLMGIRVISIFWIVYSHSFFTRIINPVFNFVEMEKFFRSMPGQFLSSMPVDTFFLMSGLLVAYTMFRHFETAMTWKSIPIMYIWRYIRIAPPLFIIILIQVTVLKFLGSGPLWDNNRNFVSDRCKKYWWSSVLFIQNYVNPKALCLEHTWYLSVDMQLFWVSPFLIILIKKYQKFTYAILALAVTILTITTFVIAYEYEILGGFTTGSSHDVMKQMTLIYLPTHTRAVPWLIGIGVGYFLDRNRSKKIKIKSILVVIGWSMSVSVIFAVIMTNYYFTQREHTFSPGEDPSYLALSRLAWTMAVAWIIIHCELTKSGPVYNFLSMDIWRPLSKLSYCLYLVHFVFQNSFAATIRQPYYFSAFQLFYTFLGDLSVSLILATILSLTYESPFIAVYKRIARQATVKNDSGSRDNTSSSDKFRIRINNGIK